MTEPDYYMLKFTARTGLHPKVLEALQVKDYHGQK
jgi:hypothetical protein